MRSAIGRKLDPAWPSNRAVLVLVPVIGLVAGLVHLLQAGGLGHAATAGFRTALAAFLGWAVARELAPDHPAAAFVAMAAALLAIVLDPSAGLTVPLLALMLARTVGRTVGLPLTWLDATAVLVLVLVTVHLVHSFAIALVGALAFGLDATLDPPHRRQWAFAAVAGVAAVIAVLTGHLPQDTPAVSLWLAGPALALLGAAAFNLHEVAAPADRTGHPLILGRVRAAMVTVLLLALAAIFAHGGPPTVLVATIAAVAPAPLVRPFRPSTR